MKQILNYQAFQAELEKSNLFQVTQKVDRKKIEKRLAKMFPFAAKLIQTKLPNQEPLYILSEDEYN